MRLVGMKLGSRRVADDPQTVCDPQPTVPSERRPPAGVDAIVLEAEELEREIASDRQEDRVAARARAVIEVDDVRSAATTGGMCLDRSNAGPNGDAVALEGRPMTSGIARVVGR